MALLPCIRQPLSGVACAIEWDEDWPVEIARPLYDMRWKRPRLPHPGGGLASTRLPQTREIPIGDPLWPMTSAGDQLRRTYLAEGERALCGMPAEPEWWDDDRDPWL